MEVRHKDDQQRDSTIDNGITPHTYKVVDACILRILHNISNRNFFSGLKENIIITVKPNSISTRGKFNDRINVDDLSRIFLSNKPHGPRCCLRTSQPQHFVNKKRGNHYQRQKEEEFVFGESHPWLHGINVAKTRLFVKVRLIVHTLGSICWLESGATRPLHIQLFH